MTKNSIKYAQNFLTSKHILNTIIKDINLKKEDILYEIGSGKGHFSQLLAEKCQSVTSIEIDKQLFDYTSKSLQKYQNLKIINKDILKFNFPNNINYKIFGNIPYNISTKIIKKVVFESIATEIFLIVESGFAKRLLNINRTLALHLMPKVNISILRKIPNYHFHPKPKVDSVLIKLERHHSKIDYIYWNKYLYFVEKWVNKQYKYLFTNNQFHKALKHANVKNLNEIKYDQLLSIFNSYILFHPNKKI